MDNPSLTVRSGKKAYQDVKPWRVVLDPRAEISPKAALFQGNQAVFLAMGEKTLRRAASRSWKAPVTLLPLKESKGQLDLKQLLGQLGSLGAASLLVEGGGETAWSFLSQGLVDRVIWITAPRFAASLKSRRRC